MLVVEEVKDLDGAENGHGLILMIGRHRDTDVDVLDIETDKIVYHIKANSVKDIEILKSFGFQFDCKPKKSVEDILNKYKEKEFEFGDENYCLVVNKDGQWAYDSEMKWKSIGTKYYSQEDCDKILYELNG